MVYIFDIVEYIALTTFLAQIYMIEVTSDNAALSTFQ